MLGLIGRKIGMTQAFDATGRLVPVTVIKIEDNVVVGHRTVEKNGYNSCVIGSFDKKRVKQPSRTQVSLKIYVHPRRLWSKYVILKKRQQLAMFLV